MSQFGYVDEQAFRRIVREVRNAERIPKHDTVGPEEPSSVPPSVSYLAKLDDTLNSGGNVTAKIWSGDPLDDSGISVDAYDWFLASGDTLAGGTKVMLKWFSGHLYVTSAGCGTIASSS